jgi:hypothetical protein
MIEPPVVKVNDISNANGAEYLIYCIDVSGSMTVTAKIDNSTVLAKQNFLRLNYLILSNNI